MELVCAVFILESGRRRLPGPEDNLRDHADESEQDAAHRAQTLHSVAQPHQQLHFA